MGRRRGGQVARWHVGLQWASSVLYFLSAEHVTISTGFLDQVQTEKQIHLLGHLSIYLCLFQFFSSVYKSFSFLCKSKYFILFVAAVDGTVFLISF